MINYLSTSIPVLAPNDTVADALELMAEQKYEALPYVREQVLEGLFSEEILESFNDDLLLSEILPLAVSDIILENDPIVEAIIKAQKSEFDLLPVVNKDVLYLGSILKSDLYEGFISSLGMQQSGGFLEIKIKASDYTLGDIARIIESENAKIVSLFTSIDEAQDLIVSIKLNLSNLGGIVNALNRYGYDVISYHSSEQFNNLEKDRYDHLMKYLSI